MKSLFSHLILALLALPTLLRSEETPLLPLRLPPGLVQTLPIVKEASYYGDSLRAVHCPDDKDNPYGTCGNLLFGGLVMLNSHLSGNVEIRFVPPAKDVAHFEVRHPGGLPGEDTYLTAPNSYRMPVKGNRVYDDDADICEGDLNLVTGEVTNLTYAVHFANTALEALGKANPKLQARVIRFPGSYGSVEAHFEQRADGLLDFTFYGTTFCPLGNKIQGDPVRFPLALCDLNLNCATIPAAGTALHPQLHLSTKLLPGPDCGDNCADIPFNTIQEFTVYGHNTYFGDKFSLTIPQLGGSGTGRSHLIGRIQVQFGEPSGGTVPFAVSSMPPAALLAEPPKTPLSIPGLSLGLLGHNEFLAFPMQTYFLRDVAQADDPFDLQLGAIDLKTGKIVGDLIYRGFIAQDLLFTLLEQNEGRVAPSSFYFHGPAQFEKGANGQTVFRFDGDVRVPFTDFRFPSPDHVKAHSWIAGPDSYLDPFLKIQAMATSDPPREVKTGSGSTVSSISDIFTYSYSIPCDPAGKEAFFDYTNHNPVNGGSFKMKTLAACHCTNSRSSMLPPGDYDTVTFTGFGSWSGDKESGLHVATVQISEAPDSPYVSIMVDGGIVSNANVKPAVAPIP